MKQVSRVTIGRSHNGRFCEMAALAPQKRQWELESYYPAGSLVKPPPRKAAGTLGAMGDAASSREFLAATFDNV